ncbi:MAG: aldose 1-epimerase [Patiriisocius sp.]|jgi:aldose 1-epimerase
MPEILGKTLSGEQVISFELKNRHGESAQILNLGASLIELKMASRSQGIINTILGYPKWESYLKDPCYHGATIGRFANRIADSQFSIGQQQFTLQQNEGEHHLHGGPHGFNTKIWQVQDYSDQHLVMSLHSPDGDQGYPGNLHVVLSYTLQDDHNLVIAWQAQCDRETEVSLCNHSYFNLAGFGEIGKHYLRIPASEFTPSDKCMIPTGHIHSVEGTLLDLRKFTQLDSVLNSDDPIIDAHGGIDHNWARGNSGQMQLSAELFSPESELLLQVSSSLPGLQCYTGNNLAKHGVHGRYEGVCLETQYYPNSPNEPQFPSARLSPGSTMCHKTQFSFSHLDREVLLKQPAT